MRPPRALAAVPVAGLGALVLALGGCTDDNRSHPAAPAVSAYGWGSDAFGQLGIASNGEARTPTAVALPHGTTAVALGRDFALAVAGGHVYSWGHNEVGELGDGSREDRFTPAVVGGFDHVVGVAAGPQYGIAVTSRGDVYAWGDGTSGQLASASIEPRLRPRKVVMPSGVHVVQVAAAPEHVVALGKTGDVYTWGDGDEGQLGIGSTKSAISPVRVHLPHGVDIRQVSAGAGHTMAVTSHHELLGWGSNESGELGLPKRLLVPSPTRIPSAGNDVAQVAAQTNGTLVRTRKGAILGAGRNDFGEMGDGGTQDHATFRAARLPAGFKAGQVTAGPTQGFAVSEDGSRIAVWGEGTAGRLGTGDDADVLTPAVQRQAVTPGAPSVKTSPQRHFVGVAAGLYAAFSLAEQGGVSRIVVDTPAGPAGAGMPQTIAARAFDAAGNDLGAPDGASASMSGGSCDGLVCTPKSPGPARIAVRAGGHRATAFLQVIPAQFVRRLPSVGATNSTAPPTAARSSHAATAGSSHDNSGVTVWTLIAVAALVMVAGAALFLRRRALKGATHS